MEFVISKKEMKLSSRNLKDFGLEWLMPQKEIDLKLIIEKGIYIGLDSIGKYSRCLLKYVNSKNYS